MYVRHPVIVFDISGGFARHNNCRTERFKLISKQLRIQQIVRRLDIPLRCTATARTVSGVDKDYAPMKHVALRYGRVVNIAHRIGFQ